MRRLFLLALLLQTATLTVLAQVQCPPPGFPEPGNTCPEAPILCENLDGYCATIDNNNVWQPFPGCSGQWTLNNDEWFAFFAGTTEIVIEVTPVNCTQGPGQEGLQGGIYAGCPPGVQIMDVQCACTQDPFILESDDYVVGQVYWFVLDGCAGNLCDYTINVLEGSTVGMPPEDPGPLTTPTVVCAGNNTQVSVAPVTGATSYFYTLTPAGMGTLSNFNNDSTANIQWGNTPGTAEVCLEVANLCYSNPVKSCISIAVEPTPTAALSGGGVLCTPTDSVALDIQLSGSAPWTVVYSYNGNPQLPVTSSNNPIVLNTNQPGIYTLLSVSGGQANCTGSVSGSVQVQYATFDSFQIDVQMPTCAEPDSGQIGIQQAAGLEFSLNNGPFQTDSVFTGLSAGTYVLTIRSTGNGCAIDTALVLTEEKIFVQTQDSLSLCLGDTIFYGDWTIFQPGLYTDTVSAAAGCDTIANVWVSGIDLPVKNEQYGVCPGDSILINGIWYAPADTSFRYRLPGTVGCDTVVTAVLNRLPRPETTVIVEFCPGDTVLIQGTSYTLPDTLTGVLLPAATGCDTLATFILKFLRPDTPAQVSIVCPGDLTVVQDPGSGGAIVNFADPVYDSDCPCPGIMLEQTAGPKTGELFPVGATQVCFQALDNCGSSASCCFSVKTDEGNACDVKTNGCLKFELLGITRDLSGDKTYRIRATNYCNNEMIYTAIQLPNGVNALRPANSSYYTGPSGKSYLVRNPNATPQHSIRFKTAGSPGINKGASEIFQYTLPEQSTPAYIHVTAKLWPDLTFAGHLNTFFCPVTFDPSPWNDKPEHRSVDEPENIQAHQVSVFPNPNDGAFELLWFGFEGETLHLRVLNAQGDVILTENLPAAVGAQPLNLPADSPAGPYAIHVFDDLGNRAVTLLIKG